MSAIPDTSMGAALALVACSLTAAPHAAAQQCPIGFVGGDLAGESPHGGLSPSLSADGRLVAYLQNVPFYHAFLYDRWTGAHSRIDTLPGRVTTDGSVSVVALSANGKRAALLGSGTVFGGPGLQICVKDLVDESLELVTIEMDGTPMTPTGTSPELGPTPIDGAGRRVVFVSDSKELVPGKTTSWRDVFVRDLQNDTTVRLLGAGGAEPDKPVLEGPSISADGRYVAFVSRATNMVPGDTNAHDDVFVHDLEQGTTVRVSMAWNGVQAQHDSSDAVISADGRFVAFQSRANNLVQGDTNLAQDVFVHDRTTGVTVRANVGPGGLQADDHALGVPRLTPDGRKVLFHSVATNLLATPTSGGRLFLRDLEQQTTTAITDPAGPVQNDVAGLSADGSIVAFASLLPFGPQDANGFFDVFVSACPPSAPSSYCVPSVSSLGCTATMSSAGTPSASAGAGFVLATTGSTPGQPGVLVYSTSAAAMLPFGAGFLCLSPPLTRTGLLVAGGSGGGCNGGFAFDFNAWIAAGSAPALAAGAPVWAQFVGRDSAVGQASVSDALSFAIGP